MTNRNYGKLRDDARIIYAPSEVKVGNTYYPAPTAEQYAAAGYLPVRDMPPAPRDGYYAVPTGYEVRDGEIVRVYEERAIETPPTYISKAKVEAVIDEMGKTAAFVAWLNSKAAYFGAWMRGGDEIAYDPTAHGGDLDSLIAALGIAQDDVPALIGKVVA